jgi:hypothetical protein
LFLTTILAQLIALVNIDTQKALQPLIDLAEEIGQIR